MPLLLVMSVPKHVFFFFFYPIRTRERWGWKGRKKEQQRWLLSTLFTFVSMLLLSHLLFAAQKAEWVITWHICFLLSLYFLELDTTTTLDLLSQKARREREREREGSVHVGIHLMLTAPPPLTKHHLSHLHKSFMFSINKNNDNPILLFQLWFPLCLIMLSSSSWDLNWHQHHH